MSGTEILLYGCLVAVVIAAGVAIVDELLRNDD